MKVLTSAFFTQPNMPVVAVPALLQPTPLAYFGSRLVTWLRPDIGVTSAGGTAAPVTQWSDQSASGIVLVPTGTGTVAPTITTTAASVGSAGLGVKMGGSTGKFFQATMADQASLKFVLGSPFAFAVTFVYGAENTYGEIFGFNRLASTPNEGFMLSTLSGQLNLVLVSNSTNATLLVSTPALTVGKAYVAVITHDGSFTAAGTTITLNGVAQTLTANIDNLGSSQGNLAIQTTGQYLQVGGGCYQGQAGGATATQASSDTIGEIIIINRGITAGEQNYLSTYLDNAFRIY